MGRGKNVAEGKKVIIIKEIAEDKTTKSFSDDRNR